MCGLFLVLLESIRNTSPRRFPNERTEPGTRSRSCFLLLYKYTKGVKDLRWKSGLRVRGERGWESVRRRGLGFIVIDHPTSRERRGIVKRSVHFTGALQ